MFVKNKDDMLFIGLIIATFFALLVIIIQSRKYNEFLDKINNENWHSSFHFDINLFVKLP
jgi:hypothetical protein